MSDAVMPESDTEKRNDPQAPFPLCAIYALGRVGQTRVVLRTADLLRILEERGIPKTEIAAVLNIGKSRVTELFKGDRALKLDEAATLVERYDLESGLDPSAAPLPVSIYQLAIRYIAGELGVSDPDPPLLHDLALDVRAFVAHVRDPRVRDSIEAAEQFFRAMRLRRPGQQSEDRLESDPHQTV